VVTIDGGKFGGVTPLRLDVSAGAHQIVVRKEGFHDLEATVEVPKGAVIPFQVDLVEAK
jgi:hypothetical protein